ncbi:MAG TPA: iron export ABC transporter permease subunit FetB [Geothermobacteraceae bacterium]|nr:iron export ABC transporter permease subunit FetB [Geothermobacteraceae bacterium]
MQSDSIVLLTLTDLALAYILVLLTLALARYQKLGREGEMLWASIRMVVQLLAIGYLLDRVFAVNHPLAVLAILLVMGLFALQVIGSRVQEKMPGFYRIMGVSLMIGCGLVAFFFCSLIVGYEPWYSPRYLIPLAGMIFGNSINGATLAAERLGSEIRSQRDAIETALSLGASPRQAIQWPLRNAFRAALIPATNSMAAMGIVALPGMMTGQILSGTAPIIAVRYQIAIMCAITGCVALTSLLILLQGYRTYFSQSQGLVLPAKKSS